MKTKAIGVLLASVFALPVVAGGIDRNDDAVEQARMGRLVMAKSFCVAMRRNHESGDAEKLRRFIDPVFLIEQGIGEEDTLPVAMAPVFSIHNIQVARDGDTVVCVVSRHTGEGEVLVLRTVERDGDVFVAPVESAGREGWFEPWTLRMKAGLER